MLISWCDNFSPYDDDKSPKYFQKNVSDNENVIKDGDSTTINSSSLPPECSFSRRTSPSV